MHLNFHPAALSRELRAALELGFFVCKIPKTLADALPSVTESLAESVMLLGH